MKEILLPMIIFVASLVLVAGPNRTLQAEQKEVVKSIELPVLAFDLADGPGRDKVSVFCGICHGTEYIPMQPKLSKAQWTATVAKMIKIFGAPVPQEDEDKIINYLATAYGTGK